jgi:D-arabinose 1-dehydrogenase-like Zn-dependent alcohol dehydrogenase
VGGLGHLAVQYAHVVGGSVVAVDVRKDKLDLATELGATHVVNALDVRPEDAVRDLGGADVAIVLAASNSAIESAFASLRPGGRLVLVSLPKDGSLSLPIFDTVLHAKQVIGSIVGTRQDLAEVFALHAAGRTRVVTEVRPCRASTRRCATCSPATSRPASCSGRNRHPAEEDERCVPWWSTSPCSETPRRSPARSPTASASATT